MITPLQSNLYNTGYQITPFEFVLIQRIGTGELIQSPTISAFDYTNICLVESLSFDPEQNSTTDEFFVGEKGITSTYSINNRKMNIKFKMLITSPITGWIDPAFALLWDSCQFSILGSSTSYITQLQNTTGTLASGTTSVAISNIEEFLNLQAGDILTITDGINTETIIFSSATLGTQTINFSTTTNIYTKANTIIAYSKPVPQGIREPAFSLVCREGILYPCFVNSISINFDAKNNLIADVSIVALNLDRTFQIQTVQYLPLLRSLLKHSLVYRPIPGMFTTVSSTASSYGNFGMETALSEVMLKGYQDNIIDYKFIESISFEVNNNLQFIHSQQHTTQTKLNYFPWAVFSDGRTIKGTINPKVNINPIRILEKIASVSNVNAGGFSLNTQAFQISMPELGYNLTKSPSIDTLQIDYKVVGTSLFSMPDLAFTNLSPYNVYNGPQEVDSDFV